MTSSLLGIAVKAARLQPMALLSEAQISCAAGLRGDSRGKPGPRQITLLSQLAWEAACAEIGAVLPWTARRANLLVDNLPLAQSTGSLLRIGEVVLEISGETDPCERMTAVHPALFNALLPDWRGGVCCRVRRGGSIEVGMPVELFMKNQAEPG